MPDGFRAVEFSGHHGATGEQVRRILDEHRDNPDVALIYGTENYNGKHDRAWKAKGWKTFRVGELTATWRLSVLEQIRPEQAGWERQLTTLHFYRGTGGRVNGLQSAVVRLRHKATKRPVIVRWAHMPSSVQQGGGWSRTIQRVRVYQSAMRQWKQIVRYTVRNHKKARGIVIVAADWNLDHKRKWVRAYLRRHLRPLRPVLTDSGTLGNREIDVSWIWGAKTSGAKVHPKRPGVDHRASSYRIHI